MNKTTKAKYDLATRMLKVDISVDEVALMSGQIGRASCRERV